jgi:hypothetical protein
MELVSRHFGSLGPLGVGFSVICDLSQRLPSKFFRRLSVSPDLHRTAVEEGSTLYGQRLVMNIANDVGLRFQKHLPALNRTFNFAVDHHAFGCNGSGDMSSASNNQRSAVKFAVNLACDSPSKCAPCSMARLL